MNQHFLNHVGEDWWIDYVEGEVDNKFKEDLENLLEFSETDREIVNNLRALRNAIKHTGDQPVPKNDQYFDMLQNSIMEKVQAATMEPPKPESGKGLKNKILESIRYLRGSL